ncbi:MAG: hypothetical protein J6I53_01270 [Treponema sp.]|nr:hypothetical protein [Treponema sp.]
MRSCRRLRTEASGRKLLLLPAAPPAFADAAILGGFSPVGALTSEVGSCGLIKISFKTKNPARLNRIFLETIGLEPTTL